MPYLAGQEHTMKKIDAIPWHLKYVSHRKKCFTHISPVSPLQQHHKVEIVVFTLQLRKLMPREKH